MQTNNISLLQRNQRARRGPRASRPAAVPSPKRQLLQLGDRCIYFFKRDHYIRYQVATVAGADGSTEVLERVDVGPAPISQFWTRLHPFFHRDLDAVVNWGNGKAYFFKKDQYIRYDIATELVDVGPARIADFWAALRPFPFFLSNLDAVVNWGDGKVYFFKKDQYVRIDIASDLVDVGPVEISRFWKRLPEFFRRKLDAVVNWTAPMNLADLFRSRGLTVNEVGDWRARARPEAFGFTPVGIMMHHTGGRNSLDALVRGRRDKRGRFLAGPLCNFHVPKSGIINLVSGGISNHSGKGGRQVLVEVTNDMPVPGTARDRRLTDHQRGAGFFYGFENENLGDGVDQWPDVQRDTMVEAAAALCRAHCWMPERIIGHLEWTARKIDPRGIEMADIRARVRDALR